MPIINLKRDEGIKETSDLVVFGASMGEAIYNTIKDKDFSAGDLLYWFPVIKAAFPAIDGIEKVPEELDLLTMEEVEHLTEKFKKEFNIPNDLAEEFVEACIAASSAIFEVADIFRKWKEQSSTTS
jgi:hypothetical protein